MKTYDLTSPEAQHDRNQRIIDGLELDMFIAVEDVILSINNGEGE